MDVASRTGLEPPEPAPPARARFGALAYREFRLLWSGLLISNTGSWMQLLAQGWLVVQLAGTPALGTLYLGLVGLVRAVPVLLLSGLAGAIADRSDRRRLLAYSNVVLGLCALSLALLTELHAVRVWHVLVVAAISSGAQAFDAPTRQSLVPLLVRRRDLMNAIGLNSAAFNAPAVIGPAIGGLLVQEIGIAPCFFINAASYGGVLLALALMTPKPPVWTDNRPGVWIEVLDGIRYVRGNRTVLSIVGLSALMAMAGRPYIALMPAVAKDVIHGGAQSLGALMAAAGAGALGGSIATALIGTRRARGALLLASASACGFALVAFSMTRTVGLGALFALLVGLSIMLFMGLTNTLLQTYTPLEMRGRVMSIYTMTFLGLMPLGTWLLGSAASLSSLPATFAAAGALIVVSALLAWRLTNLRELP